MLIQIHAVYSRAMRAFDIVRRVGLTLPDIESAIRYDGSPVLKAGGVFVAGLAKHAEPATLVVRCEIDDRDRLIEDAPETYYVTDYYMPYPVVLARLPQLNRDALRDLLSVSRRMALAKCRRAQKRSAGHRRSRP
jgi:hypothetical protein